MPGRAARTVQGAGALLLGLVGAVGLAATALYLLVGTSAGTAFLVPRVLELVNGAIQGRLEADAVRMTSRGTVEITGARVRDPGGEVVVSAERVLARVDLLRLRLRTVSAEVDVHAPSVRLLRTPQGELTIAQAFRARHPSPQEEARGGSAWTFRLARLAIDGGSVELAGPGGARQLDVRELGVRASAATSRAGSSAELVLEAQLARPEQGRVSVDAAASLRGGLARVSRLRAAAGDSAIDAVGEWDLATASGRALVRSVVLSAADLARVLPRSPLAGDLQGTVFAAADHGVATAAFDVAQRDGPGRTSGSAALRMSGPLTLGLVADVLQLDPAQVVASAPAGEVTAAVRGWLRGTDPRTLRAAVALDAAPSTLRGGRVGPLKLVGAAGGGSYRVESVDAVIPGARLRGSGRYALGGGIAGAVHLQADDLAAASRTVERLASVRLPDLRGAAAVTADVGGTVRAPQVRFEVTSSGLAAATVRARGLRVSGDASGTFAQPRARVAGTAAELQLGGERVRNVELAASIEDRAVEARVTGVTPRVGPDHLTVAAQGALARDWRSANVSRLSIAWPGAIYALTAPARIDFAGPHVDRLELSSGGSRIAIEGGLVPGKATRRRPRPAARAETRVVAEALDLSTLPRGLLPAQLALSGIVALDARVTGPTSAPEIVAHVEGSEVAVAGLSGLSVRADATWDGARRRAGGVAAIRRDAGGEVDLRLDVPTALGRARASEAVDVSVVARGLPIADAAHLAHRPEPVTGVADLDLALTGSVGAPSMKARAALSELQYGGYGPFQLDASLDAPGRTAQLETTLSNKGERTIELTASVPLDLAAVLRQPATAARHVLDAPLQAEVNIPEFDLARFAGEFGMPDDLAGRLRGSAGLKGTLRAPRGSLGIEAGDVGAYGYRDGALQLAMLLSPDSTGVAGSVSVGGEEFVQVSGLLGVTVEKLVQSGRLEQVPFDVDLVFPGADLARAGGTVPLAGRVDGQVSASGTYAQPVVDVALQGHRVSVSGHPLGDVEAKAHAAGMSLSADVHVDVASGGQLTASLKSTAEVSLASLQRGDLADAPSELRIVADRVDLGVLPALLPGTVRVASGELGADLAATGPLRSLRPLGSVRVTQGRVAIAEMGDWTGIEVDASMTADAFRVDRLQARRGKGTLDAKAEARGLSRISGPNPQAAPFTADVRTRGLTITRAGQDLAKIDLDAQAKGSFDVDRLRAEVTVSRGTVVLPERSTRPVQPLGTRDDITIVKSFDRKPPKPAEEAPSHPYRATVRVLAANRFFVTSTNPRMNIELQADTTFDAVGSRVYAEGQVEVLHGYVEPFSNRVFNIERGRVTFTGGPPNDAVLDIVALYHNPAADVTVTISGNAAKPDTKLTSSNPNMDESQAALLVATGRTDMKVGAGNVGTLSGGETGKAALGLVATQLFKNVVADKLPVASLSLGSSELRAGTYVSSKIYVGYTWNFDAQPEKFQNTNELRIEYQIAPRWTLETFYGDAHTGGASVIWSKDY